MSGFTKLASSIVTSSVWVQDDHVLRVWIAMLATSDANGVVEASIPGFANLCRISIEQMEDAVKKLSDVDAYSRSPDYDGRRIDKIDGGWLVLNYAKYRARRDPEERKRQVREAVAKHRANVSQCKPDVSQGKPRKAQAEAEAEAEANNKGDVETPVSTPIPFEKILSLYHESLPELPRCIKLTRTRQGYIRQRWAEDLPDLEAWKKYFEIVHASRFLMGKAPPRNGSPPFRATLDWLCRPENCCKVVEGKYG